MKVHSTATEDWNSTTNAGDWREKPKAVLSIVHGLGEHSGRYGNVVDWFAPKRYAVYAFDLRGFGRSPGRRGYINEWVEFRQDVKAFLEFVHEQEPGQTVFLLGHSMGGLIVLEYVLHHPEGLAGVIASGPALSVDIPPFLMVLSKVLSGILPRLAFNTGLDATALARDPAVVEAYVNDPLVHSLSTPRFGIEFPRAGEWTQAHAAEMRIPCLIVHGGADRLVPPEGSRIFYENMTILIRSGWSATVTITRFSTTLARRRFWRRWRRGWMSICRGLSESLFDTPCLCVRMAQLCEGDLFLPWKRHL